MYVYVCVCVCTHMHAVVCIWGFPHVQVASLVMNPSTVQETQVWSLGWEDPLEEGMAIHSSIFAWKIPWTEEPGGL